MRYRFTLQARNDLKDILVEGILTFGDLQALKYQDSLQKTLQLLAYMPNIGRPSERNKENERRFLHGKHVIYYRVEPEQIVINAIIYGPIIPDIWGEI